MVSISSIIIIHHPSSIFHLPSTLTIPTRVYFDVAYNQKPSPPTFKNPSIFLSSTRLRAIRVLPDFCPLDPITSIRLPLSIFHLPVSLCLLATLHQCLYGNLHLYLLPSSCMYITSSLSPPSIFHLSLAFFPRSRNYPPNLPSYITPSFTQKVQVYVCWLGLSTDFVAVSHPMFETFELLFLYNRTVAYLRDCLRQWL